MNIQIRSITDPDNLNSGFKQIYEDTFPPDERRSWLQMASLFVNPQFCMSEIYLKQEFIGFIAVWNLEDFRFIEHFAILDSLRGKGYGSQVLNYILSQKTSPVILEVEKMTSDLSMKRISFYEKLGFHLSDFEYFQPPYSIDKNKVKMLLMSYPDKIKSDDFEWIKNKIYKMVYQSIG